MTSRFAFLYFDQSHYVFLPRRESGTYRILNGRANHVTDILQHVIRNPLGKARRKSKLYLFNVLGAIIPYSSLVTLAFVL